MGYEINQSDRVVIARAVVTLENFALQLKADPLFTGHTVASVGIKQAHAITVADVGHLRGILNATEPRDWR